MPAICRSCQFMFDGLDGKCPSCGSSAVLSLVEGGGDPLAVIESAQRMGLWDRAYSLLDSYRSSGELTFADYNLIGAQVEMRRLCVGRMLELRSEMHGDTLRRALCLEFDSYSANWALDVYLGGSNG